MKILVAEDEEVLREAVGAILEVKEYDFLTVNDGQYAWEALPSYQPDLLITDIKMPRMSGLELVEKMRTENYKELPVIILSAYASKEFRSQAEALHVARYVTKPFSFHDLVEAVQAVECSINR